MAESLKVILINFFGLFLSNKNAKKNANFQMNFQQIFLFF